MWDFIGKTHCVKTNVFWRIGANFNVWWKSEDKTEDLKPRTKYHVAKNEAEAEAEAEAEEDAPVDNVTLYHHDVSNTRGVWMCDFDQKIVVSQKRCEIDVQLQSLTVAKSKILHLPWPWMTSEGHFCLFESVDGQNLHISRAWSNHSRTISRNVRSRPILYKRRQFLTDRT